MLKTLQQLAEVCETCGLPTTTAHGMQNLFVSSASTGPGACKHEMRGDDQGRDKNISCKEQSSNLAQEGIKVHTSLVGAVS